MQNWLVMHYAVFMDEVTLAQQQGLEDLQMHYAILDLKNVEEILLDFVNYHFVQENLD